MWTRYHIKCNNCEKITNLRIQIPEIERLQVSLYCLGCSSELRATLFVDFEKASWDFKVERGILIDGEFESGDYFLEFSDTLSTGKPSDSPHDILMPTMRMPSNELQKLAITKDLRKMHSNEQWEDLKDLARAYVRFDKDIIEKLAKKIIGEVYPEKLFTYRIELDYHRNYFLSLNYLIYPWIDFDSHSTFVSWLDKKIFKLDHLENAEFVDFILNVATDDMCNRLKIDLCELTIRFVDLREYFYYANNQSNNNDSFAAIHDFTKLKNFYTDCFEFIGRTSHLIFRLQNFCERGSQNAVPAGTPRNVRSATDFATLDHGKKLYVLKLSNEVEPKLLYTNSFDNKLRNGINHFKARLNSRTQIISYFPNPKRPDEEFQIGYVDFLNSSLDAFNSVLKIGQLTKMISIYKFIDKKKKGVI